MIVAFAVLEFDHNGSGLPAGSQFSGAAAAVPGVTKAILEAVGQEVENIENGGFAAAIRPKQGR